MKNINVGLFLLRVSLGLMMLFGHGLEKLSGFAAKAEAFPAIFGMSPKISLSVAIFAEFFCALFVVLGLFTRASAALIAITMAVAVFMVHASDPFATKELAACYLVGFLVIVLLGPGQFSVDEKKSFKW